jgi:hypothetical protein
LDIEALSDKTAGSEGLHDLWHIVTGYGRDQ